MNSRLKEKYEKEIVPVLLKELGIDLEAEAKKVQKKQESKKPTEKLDELIK